MKNLLLLTPFLVTFFLLCEAHDKLPAESNNIVSLDQLNDAIKNGPNRKVGFLSHANYESVEAFLDGNVEPVIFGDSIEIEIAVMSEEVVAGKLMSF